MNNIFRSIFATNYPSHSRLFTLFNFQLHFLKSAFIFFFMSKHTWIDKIARAWKFKRESGSCKNSLDRMKNCLTQTVSLKKITWSKLSQWSWWSFRRSSRFSDRLFFANAKSSVASRVETMALAPEVVTSVEVQKRRFTDCLLVDLSSSIIDGRMSEERGSRGKKHLGTRETSEREFRFFMETT